jgi:hypothetical protein
MFRSLTSELRCEVLRPGGRYGYAVLINLLEALPLIWINPRSAKLCSAYHRRAAARG